MFGATFRSNVLGRLDALAAQLTQLSAQVAAAARLTTSQEGEIMATLDDIIAKVNAEKTVEDSAVALLGQLSGQIKTLAAEVAAAGQDPAKLQALADTIDANTAALAAAVTANTPAAPTP